MTDIAIRVENLSKQYRIGGPQAHYSYRSLRESLTEAVGAPFRRLSSVVRGQSSAVSNETIWALKDVSFEVKRGEVLGIIGRNGAGKTTLLKILSRITEPTEGYAEIHGRVGSLLEVGTGFHPELTGRENITLNGAILGMKRAEIERKFDEIVAFSGVEKFIDTPVKHYSSGMHVRLAFAVAAHLEPEILLVDEVLAVGDVAFQKKCLGKMGEVAGEGRTVLFVSHNMTAVKALCSRSVLLQSGQIVFNGLASSCVEEYLSRVSPSISKNIPISQREREKRLSLRAKIVGITIVTEQGETQEVLHSDKPFVIRLTIRSFSDTRCGIHLGIRDRQDQVLIWLNSACLQNKLFLFEKGTSQVDCKIDPTYLASGDYTITCGLTIPNQEWIDFVREAYFFSIKEFDPYGTGYDLSQKCGRYHVNHRWEDVRVITRGDE